MTAGRRTGRLLREGDTCWKLAPAGRVAFLVDGEAFFAAAADALCNAQRCVWLVGWDFHSAVRLRRNGPATHSEDLTHLLERLVRARPELQVRVLVWNSAMLYALEREYLPRFRFQRIHRRIHFAADSEHPLAGSQHQKLLVVDDLVAFTGGFDLSAERWDTRRHQADEPRRVSPSGRRYPPFHDVQIAVDHEAASALALLARERWRRATGETMHPCAASGDPWPAKLEPHVHDVMVGISRTLPSYDGAPEVREVETLYHACIAAARRWIYVENQYLTSARVAGWLAARLMQPDGPEIVIVGPQKNAGWLEESTMGTLRDRVVRLLRKADRYGRLRVLYPHVAGLPGGWSLNVHAKVMVVDDTLARVGSSNLSARSLGLDSECDVAIEAAGRKHVHRAIDAFRDDLLAEHLGTTASRVAECLRHTGSLVATVDALSGGERTLRPLELEAGDWAGDALEAIGAVDPDFPVPLEELVERLEPAAHEPAPRARARRRASLLALAVALAALTLAWQTGPLAHAVEPEPMAAALGFLRESWLGPIAATALFALASCLLVPVTALTLAAGLALGPWIGIPVAWIGCTAGATLGYLAGHLFWRGAMRRLAGRRMQALSRRLARRGILSSSVVRLVPIAPFMVVNLVAGASDVRARDFIAGTALGVLPGTIALVLAGDGITFVYGGAVGLPWLWAALGVLALFGMLQALRHLPRPGTTPDPGRD